MAFIAASRVLETFTTTGAGTITLGGALVGYRTFASALSNADTCFYFMEGGSDYEIGYGTYSAGTLARTTVLKSSNANAAVNWASGIKTVGIAPLGPSDLDSTNLDRFLGVLGVATGNYFPTATGVTNMASVTAGRALYIRIGAQVFVSFYTTPDVTLAAPTSSSFRLSLPFASNIGSADDVSGSGAVQNQTGSAIVNGDSANDAALVTFMAQTTAAVNLLGTFGYRII